MPRQTQFSDIEEQDEIYGSIDGINVQLAYRRISESDANGNMKVDSKEHRASIRQEQKDKDAVRAYFAEVTKIHLLSEEDELERGKQIQKTRDAYAKIKEDISEIKIKLNVFDKQCSLLESGERLALTRRMEALALEEKEAESCFSSACNELVRHNLRLVIYYANHYLDKGLSLLDLIQEGNIGLMRAAERYQWSYGYRFSTYASWWIKQTIRRAIISDSRLIRLPSYIFELLPKMIEYQAMFIKEHGYSPTVKELSILTGFRESKVKNILSAVHVTLSIDSHPEGEPDILLGDIIPDDRSPSSYENAMVKELQKLISKQLKKLSDKECDILEHRHGLGRYRREGPKTLDQIAGPKHKSPEHIRQIESQAMKSLKDKCGNLLREYWFG